MPEGTWNLLLAAFVVVATVAVPRLWRRWPAWLRMALGIAAVAVLTLLVGRLLGSPLAPRFASDGALWQPVIEAAWWVLAGRVAVGAVRLFLVVKDRPRETRILSDLLAAAIHVAVGLAIVTLVFAVPIGGLLATSGVVAIVLGLALQSTLSDVFSGLAVGLEKPYRAGDLLWVEGDIEGQVIQVNWRSTQIGTIDNNVAIVPNSIIAKSKLVNRSAPTPRRFSGIDIRLDPRAIPEQCAETLLAAARGCGTLLDEPAPSVACTGLRGDALSYRINFAIPTSTVLVAARDELFARVHRHLRHAGIALAIDGKGRLRPAAAPTVAQLLETSDLFGPMQATDRDALATHFEVIRLRPGEVLLEQNQVPDALLLIAAGTLGVSLPGSQTSRIVNRLGPGETLGAAGLVTGAPFTATAAALTAMTLHRLDKDALVVAIAARPDLALAMEALAERVIEAMRRNGVAEADTASARSDALRDKLRGFLRLLNARA